MTVKLLRCVHRADCCNYLECHQVADRGPRLWGRKLEVDVSVPVRSQLLVHLEREHSAVYQVGETRCQSSERCRLNGASPSAETRSILERVHNSVHTRLWSGTHIKLEDNMRYLI